MPVLIGSRLESNEVLNHQITVCRWDYVFSLLINSIASHRVILLLHGIDANFALASLLWCFDYNGLIVALP